MVSFFVNLFYKIYHLLYRIVQPIIQLAFFFFYRSIWVNNKELFKSKGPLLLTVNHPNALIDAIVLAVYFKQPIHFLTRGDAFNTPLKRWCLSKLNMIPIYRLRDGIENLHLNGYAFNKSKEVLKNKGIVLIFIEGICKHTHQLQPFKKGAARIALNCWNENIPVKIMPITIQYSSLLEPIKQIHICLNKIVTKEELTQTNDDAKNYVFFNTILGQQMNSMLMQKKEQSKKNYSRVAIKKLFHFICLPIYILVEKWVANKTRNTVFYHSILFATLLIFVPVYFMLLVLLINFL